MPADQVRGARTNAPTACAFRSRFNELRVIGKAKIVIAGKGKHLLAANVDERRAGRIRLPALPTQCGCIGTFQCVAQIIQQFELGVLHGQKKVGSMAWSPILSRIRLFHPPCSVQRHPITSVTFW